MMAAAWFRYALYWPPLRLLRWSVRVMDRAFSAASSIADGARKQSDGLRPPRSAWAPLPIVFVAVIGLWFDNIQTPSESPSLLIALNLLLATAPGLGIAFLFLRSFLMTGAPGVALFGCGAVLWSASGLAPFALASAEPASSQVNSAVTIHNLTVWGASLCYLAGAALLQRDWPPIKSRILAIAAAYSAALALAAIIGFMAVQALTPVFFVQGKGASIERQLVLASTIYAIVLTLLLLRKGVSQRSAFLDWFALALKLFAIGYIGILLQTTVGGVLGWASRLAQFLGGGYMLAAAYVALRDEKPAFVHLAPSEEMAPQRNAVAIAIVLIAAVGRLVFLQTLGTAVPFLTFYPAVMLAALYGGLRAGAVATLFAATLANYLWLEPVGSLAVWSAADMLSIAIFVFNCLLVSWIVELLQRAHRRLQRADAERRAELERRVAERTAELGLARDQAELANEAMSRSLASATSTEAELQAVFDAVPAGIWITRDPSCLTMQGNRLGNAWMRIPDGANASKSAPDPSILRFEVFDKEGAPVPNDWLPMQRAGRGEEVMDYEFEWRFPDGERLSLYGNATPLRDEAGNIAGAVAAFINVTERKRAEEALRESEERLSAALRAGKLGVYDYNPRTGQLNWDPAVYRLFGVPEDEPVTYEMFEAGIHPEDLAAVRAVIERAIAFGGDHHYECEYRVVSRADGTVRWIFKDGNVTFDAEGPCRLVGTVQDITERKRAEAALRESEERLRHLGDSLPYGAVYRYSHEASGAIRFHYISAGIERLNGVRVEDVLRDAGALHRQILPDYFSKLVEAERLSAREMSDFEMEVPMRRPDGELRWMRLQSRPHRTEDGSVIWDGAQTDITERKRAEAALRESEERFRGIYEHAAFGISITDLQYRFLSGNAAYTAMLGYTEEELRAANFPNLVHPEDIEENLIELSRLIAQEIPSFELVNRYIAKGGKPIWVHKRVSLLRDAAGAPTNLIALVTDISERKRQEEQIGLLMREVNHRAKNMLALVQAIARHTAAKNPEDFVERFGERVRALAASQDLLVKSEWKGVNLHDLVRSQLAHFNDLIGERIAVDGPELFISASAAQTIGMALHELATNAGKYGALSNASGVVRLGWRLEPCNSGEERFTITWRENGGPPVQKPAQTGFGSTVIDRMVRMSLEAVVDLDFARDGAVWRLDCASGKVLEAADSFVFVNGGEDDDGPRKLDAASPGPSRRAAEQPG